MISSHAAERSPSYRGDIIIKDEPFPYPKRRAGHEAHPGRYNIPKSWGTPSSNICSSSRLPSRLMPSVLVAVDIKHFHSSETHPNELASVAVRSPSPPASLLASLPALRFHPPFRPYFHSMALPGYGETDTTIPGPRRVIRSRRSLFSTLWGKQRLA